MPVEPVSPILPEDPIPAGTFDIPHGREDYERSVEKRFLHAQKELNLLMSMTLTDKRSVAAAGSVDNILDGKLGEILPRDSLVQVAITGSVDSCDARVLVSNQVVVDNQEVDDANTSPLFPDHVLCEFRGLAGDRLIIGLRNGNAAACVVRTKVKIIPLA